MKPGTPVSWNANRGAYIQRLEGRIVAVLQPGELPTAHRLDRLGLSHLRPLVGNATVPRDEVSFLTECNGAVYWPSVKAIRAIKVPA